MNLLVIRLPFFSFVVFVFILFSDPCLMLESNTKYLIPNTESHALIPSVRAALHWEFPDLMPQSASRPWHPADL